jgi:hypothetical protein
MRNAVCDSLLLLFKLPTEAGLYQRDQLLQGNSKTHHVQDKNNNVYTQK